MPTRIQKENLDDELIHSVVAGSGISVDDTDANNPVISATGEGTDDQTAAEVPFTPAGNIAATDVQAALEELDTEKASSSHVHSLSQIIDSGALAELDTVDTAQIDNDAVTVAKIADAQLKSLAGLVPGTEGRLIESDGLGGFQMATAATVVQNAGALMDSEVTNLAQVKAFDSSDYATAAQGTTADSALQPGDVDDTPVNGATTAPVSSNWAFDHDVSASTTVEGHVELATTAEVNTGTDTTRAVTADAVAGSYAGTKSVAIQIQDGATALATGDGKAFFIVPAELNGMNLVAVRAGVVTAGTTGTTDIQIHNVTDAVDVLSTKLTIDSGETTSATAATAAVINAANDAAATDDVWRIDVDAVQTTAPEGGFITLTFQLP